MNMRAENCAEGTLTFDMVCPKCKETVQFVIEGNAITFVGEKAEDDE